MKMEELLSERDYLLAEIEVLKDILTITEKTVKDYEEEIEKFNKQLIELSHWSGKAELATEILHNVGNVLNSLNIGAEKIKRSLKNSSLNSLDKVNEMIKSHDHNLAEFITQDKRGKNLPEYFIQLARQSKAEREEMENLTENILKHLGHVQTIISVQQGYAKNVSLIEEVSIPEVIEDALRIFPGDFSRNNINITKEFEETPRVKTDRQKVLQILVNLFRNAKYAVIRSDKPEREIYLCLKNSDDHIVIEVIDNGIGIIPENMPRIFQYGFTTTAKGHGFGLHSSANLAAQLGGSIKAESKGEGKGARFIVELPIKKGGFHGQSS